MLLAREETDEARKLLAEFAGDFVVEGLAARIELADADDVPESLSAAFAAWDAGDHETALERLQEAIAASPIPSAAT